MTTSPAATSPSGVASVPPSLRSYRADQRRPTQASRSIPSPASSPISGARHHVASASIDATTARQVPSSPSSPSQAATAATSKLASARFGSPGNSSPVPSRPPQFHRMSTATSISTLSGGGGGGGGTSSAPYPSSLSQPYTSDGLQLTKRTTAAYYRQSDLTAYAEQLSSTTTAQIARPVVDLHDAIWADLDIMDDIESVSQEVSDEGNFFGASHVAALADLQATQIELATAMENNEASIGSIDQSKLWDLNNQADATSLDDISTVFRVVSFDSVQQIVDNAMLKLDKVVDTMKVLENQSKDLWTEKQDHV
ncbi:uncharacterized protein V1518DRAFT_409151 [Limtongia smithiae]|uniref:uncharacterized protein n=1 Tax=Limtongia smithiae TaxID=1125753 RepID=UPI0034CECF9C